LTTGFDCPSIEVIILYRATTSLPLFLQMVGRGSRIAPGKDRFTILDFGDNFSRHNFWHAQREWTLNKEEKREGVAPVKECPECNYMLAASAMECPECGHIFKTAEQAKKEREFAELALLDAWQIRQVAKEKSVSELAEMAKAGLVKPTWAIHQIYDRSEAKEFARLMGYKSGWLWYAEKTFKNLPWLRAQKQVL
jgi:superfamily II DNA or RNA helicase